MTLRVLPQSDGLPHDLIDPRQPDAAVDIIYPMLLEMMSADAPPRGENADQSARQAPLP